MLANAAAHTYTDTPSERERARAARTSLGRREIKMKEKPEDQTAERS